LRRRYYRDLDHSFIPITFFYPNMPHPFRNKCLRARQMFEGIFQKIIAERRAKGEVFDDFLQVPPGCSQSTWYLRLTALFMQVLMDSKYKDGQPLSMQEITGIMVATLLGGQHTSNVTGTWALLHMLLEPQWYKACLAEQHTLLGSNYGSDSLEYEHTKQMNAFDRVISEVLRLHPPFFQLSRVVTEDTEFNGAVMAKVFGLFGGGTCISYSKNNTRARYPQGPLG
jgi:sterol 14-demethylase